MRPIDRRIGALADVLTESEQRLAKVVLEAQEALGSYTAGELASLAGVSTATAARFFQRLGYATFGAVRRQARDLHWASPLAVGAADGTDLAGHVEADCRNLVRTAEGLPPEALQEAVGLLAGARTLWVVGFRNSAPLAGLARALLVTVKDDVRLLPQAGMTVAEDLAGLGPGQVMLAVGFRRRPALLRDVIRVAREAGVPSVLIADDSAVVTAREARVTLRCHIAGQGPYDSYAAAVSVLNYLVVRVWEALGEAGTERLRTIEARHERLSAFETTMRVRAGPG